jgi:hypothetical protein
MSRKVLVSGLVLAIASGVHLGQAAQSGASASGSIQQPVAPPATSPSGHQHGSDNSHGAATPAITYAELQRTNDQLAAAHQATAKYQDVRVAEADGYRAIGPNTPGMGTHYVRLGNHNRLSVTEPPILLYEQDPSAPNGLRLVGVSYLLVAPMGADGQPATSPFPKALATWHKHNNVCVLPDNSASVQLTEEQCKAKGGNFTSETSWMLHAWIWKDSPSGVFSPTNPLVK